MPTPSALLFGVLSLDIYVERDVVLPGGGTLNMAWHWRRLGHPFRLMTRIGDDRPAVFLDFLDRHGIPFFPDAIVGRGPSAAIDIVIRPDGQPWMDHFVEGVWSDLRLTDEEIDAIAVTTSVHAVLTEGVITVMRRLGRGGALTRPLVTADFLDFRHFTVERFDQVLVEAGIDVAFIGWPGAIDDPIIAGVRRVATTRGRSVVITRGAHAVTVIDGPAGTERTFPVTAVPVIGTTVGCGDAFIAGFLASYHDDPDIAAAVAAGAVAGAMVTAWDRPLPDDAYGAGVEALRRPTVDAT